jgi:hypothetical protein
VEELKFLSFFENPLTIEENTLIMRHNIASTANTTAMQNNATSKLSEIDILNFTYFLVIV